MKRFLFLSKVLAGCAFFSNYHAQNNSSLLGSTNLIAIKKMVSRKKFPIFNFKFSDGQKKSAQSSEKAIDVVYIKIAPETFLEILGRRFSSINVWFAVGYTFYITGALDFIVKVIKELHCVYHEFRCGNI